MVVSPTMTDCQFSRARDVRRLFVFLSFWLLLVAA